MPRPDSSHENDHDAAAERRLQVAAALGLGLVVLIAVVLRAGIHTVFPAGWWPAW